MIVLCRITMRIEAGRSSGIREEDDLSWFRLAACPPRFGLVHDARLHQHRDRLEAFGGATGPLPRVVPLSFCLQVKPPMQENGAGSAPTPWIQRRDTATCTMFTSLATYDKLFPMRRAILPAVLVAAVFVSACDLQKLIAPEHAAKPVFAYKNPHRGCVACHATEKPRAGGALFAPGTDSSAVCLNCHDYQENHHPTDVIPNASQNTPFPLVDGRIRCLTCHEIHGGPAREGTPKLLRDGPYPDRRDICFRCHSQEQYATINPHRMLDAGNTVREVNGRPACLLCHAKMPDPSKDYTGDVRFRADVGFLCWRCHPPMPDPFFRSHFLTTPSATTRSKMHQTEETFLVILPLVPRERITCSTCHNPHQAGVIQRESAAKGADVKSKLRMSQICFACHLKQ